MIDIKMVTKGPLTRDELPSLNKKITQPVNRQTVLSLNKPTVSGTASQTGGRQSSTVPRTNASNPGSRPAQRPGGYQTSASQSPQRQSGYQSPTSQTPQRQSGYQSPTSQTPQRQSGYQTPTSQTSQRQGGYQPPTSQTPQRQSGYQTPTSQTPQRQSGYQTPTSQTSQRQGGYQSPTSQTPQRQSGYQTPTSQTPQRQGGYQAPTSQTPQRQSGYQSPASQAPRQQAPVSQPTPPRLPDLPTPPLRNLLRKGQKTPLDPRNQGIRNLRVCCGWNLKDSRCDMDASAFLVGANGRVPSDDWFVFYGQTESPDRSVSFGMDRSGQDREVITVDLNRMDPSIRRIVFVLTIDQAFQYNLNFSMIRDAYVRIMDGRTGQEILSYRLEEYYANVTSMTLGELYLHNGQWKFNPVGNGAHQDLAGQCAIYGVEIA